MSGPSANLITLGENHATLIEQWNGSNWSVVPSPSFYGNLSSVAAVSANDVWAVGSNIDSLDIYTLIEHWNGSSWSVIPSPSPGPYNDYYDYLSSVAAVSANDVWAVGKERDSSGNQVTLIEHWDGSFWSVVSSPNPTGGGFIELTGVSVASTNDVWAVGTYEDLNAFFETLIERWNGTSWTIVPSPNLGLGSYNYGFTDVAAVSANDVWAVGYYELGTLIEQWNGTQWSVIPSPSPSPYGENGLNSVAAVSANDIWAVGAMSIHRITLRFAIEHWNGSTWKVVPSPNPGPGELGGNGLNSVAG